MNTPARKPSSEELLKQQLAALEESQVALQFGELSRRVKKRPVVLFFGRNTFSDNTKYLFLRAAAEKRSYDVLWCTFEPELVTALRSAGLPVHVLAEDIDRSIDLLMHAAVAVFSVNPSESLRGSMALGACLDGAKKLQLWHGVSVKHLLLTLIPHLSVRELGLRRPWDLASRADYVLSTASYFDAYWRRVFGCKKLVRAGFPRNEVIVRTATPLERLGCELPNEMADLLSGDRKKVLVVPTWQRFNPTWLTSEECLRGLSELGQKRGITFFVKAHPTYFAQLGNNTHEVGGLQILHPGVDVYPLMSSFDALVTDYSSILFDFLHTGKPVLSLDLKKGEHQNYEPDWSLVPEIDFRHRFSSGDFAAKLETALGRDGLDGARREMCARIFETDPLAASDALLALIERLVQAAIADDFTVDHCAPGAAAASSESELSPVAGKRSLTDAA
jgi:CDP-glycerol glycerophosphotransferase